MRGKFTKKKYWKHEKVSQIENSVLSFTNRMDQMETRGEVEFLYQQRLNNKTWIHRELYVQHLKSDELSG